MLIILFFAQLLFFSLPYQGVMIKDFSLRNAVDGSTFSLSEIGQNKAVVVIFTSNYCPYAKLYERRITEHIDAYRQQGIKFVLVNPNKSSQSPTDTPEKMAKKVESMRWNVPYLIDNEQQVATLFEVQKTPEVFVLQNSGDGYQILYRGAIDDNPQVAADVSHHYLKDALNAVLSNKPIAIEDTHATGCMIKY